MLVVLEAKPIKWRLVESVLRTLQFALMGPSTDTLWSMTDHHGSQSPASVRVVQRVELVSRLVVALLGLLKGNYSLTSQTTVVGVLVSFMHSSRWSNTSRDAFVRLGGMRAFVLLLGSGVVPTLQQTICFALHTLVLPTTSRTDGSTASVSPRVALQPSPRQSHVRSRRVITAASTVVRRQTPLSTSARVTTACSGPWAAWAARNRNSEFFGNLEIGIRFPLPDKPCAITLARRSLLAERFAAIVDDRRVCH